MNSSVTCDRCGHDFEITDNFGEIRRGDITVQYFRCPECKAKYHVLTTNPAMRKLIDRRSAIQKFYCKSAAKSTVSGSFIKNFFADFFQTGH